jgi:DNA-binding transcriptional MerR regulator
METPKRKKRQVKRGALTATPLKVGSPELGVPTLTVGQIVEQLGPASPDAAAAMRERIRHWTREGLLSPVDQHHAGTGRHRRYSPDTMYETAVLDALASAGLHLVSRPYIKAALRQTRAVLQKWRKARASGQEAPLFFLIISHEKTRIGGEPTMSIQEGIVKQDRTAEIMIVVNLSQLFLDARRTSAEYRDNDQTAGPKQRG